MELNKAVLDCMQALRRRLREELNQEIRLSQPDVIESMLLACLHSNDPETRKLGIQLAELTEFHGTSKPATPTPAQRPVETSPNLESDAHAGSVRMYRGQRVYA